jgi:hypothetical protein
VYVFDSERQLLVDSNDGDGGRVYAPHVVVDLEGDGSKEIIVGRGHEVVAYSWSGDSSALDRRWVASTTTAGNPPEVRGLAAADLDRDGLIEVVATTARVAAIQPPLGRRQRRRPESSGTQRLWLLRAQRGDRGH